MPQLQIEIELQEHLNYVGLHSSLQQERCRELLSYRDQEWSSYHLPGDQYWSVDMADDDLLLQFKRAVGIVHASTLMAGHLTDDADYQKNEGCQSEHDPDDPPSFTDDEYRKMTDAIGEQYPQLV
jgi:hypothetical protein